MDYETTLILEKLQLLDEVKALKKELEYKDKMIARLMELCDYKDEKENNLSKNIKAKNSIIGERENLIETIIIFLKEHDALDQGLYEDEVKDFVEIILAKLPGYKAEKCKAFLLDDKEADYDENDYQDEEECHELKDKTPKGEEQYEDILEDKAKIPEQEEKEAEKEDDPHKFIQSFFEFPTA